MKRKKHTFRKILLSLLFLAVVAGLAALPLLTANQAPEDNKVSILADTVQRRSLTRVISGGSALLTDYSAEISIPEGVRVIEYLVSNGDLVQPGDVIARVDDVSVMTAVQSVQETLASLEKSIQTARNKITPGIITAGEDGTLSVNGTAIEDSKLADYTNYSKLTDQHREYEELLLELFLLHQSGEVSASSGGMVEGLDKSVLMPLGYTGGAQLVFLGVNTPGGTDDNTYFCQVYGIVSVDGDTMQVQAGSSCDGVQDLQNLSWVDWNPSGAIQELPVERAAFVNNGGAWSVVTPKRGDILMYAFGSGGAQPTGWILKIGTYSPPTAGGEQGGGQGNGQSMRPGGGGSGGGLPSGFDWSQISGITGGRTGGSTGGSSSQAAALYSTGRTTLCAVTPMEKMYLSLNVDERDISQLTLGMEAQVTLDALPRETFTAVITDISSFGTNSGGSSKFAVELELDRSEKMLPGMNASVTLTVERLEKVLTVPVAALVDTGNHTVVYTALDETGALTAPVSVELGLSDGEYAEIRSGLKEGQSIRYSYYDTVEISNAVETRGMFGR